MRDTQPPSPAYSAIDIRLEGHEEENPQAERAVIVGLDGHSSGVLKKVPGALAVENDEWVDFLDVRGCDEAWYEGNGDVLAWYGI